MGVARLKEALETNDWEGGDNNGDDINPEDFDDDEDEGSVGFGIDPKELEGEMVGMKQAIYGGTMGEDEGGGGEAEGDLEVEQLQAMMLKMQAVRGEYDSRT